MMRRAVQWTCAASLALTAQTACAQSGVTVYGILDSYLDSSHAGNVSASRLQSGGVSGSRIGFKGMEDLGGGSRAVFALEAGINLDDGSSGQSGVLFGRQAWVGLGGNAGEITVGRHYSPYFFNLVTYGLGGGMGWGNASNYFTDASVLRVNNSLSYASPVMNGFRLRALYGFGENTTLPGGSTIGNIHSASLQYDRERFSANLAYEQRNTSQLNQDRYYAAGASYDFGVLKASVLLQARRDDLNAARNNAAELSVQVPVARGYLLLDLGRVANRSVADADSLALSIRYDHYLSTRTMLYTGIARIRNDGHARYGINGNTGTALSVNAGDDPRALILGVRHQF